MGVLASGPEIQRQIQEMVQFQENGSFNMDKYKSLLKSNRLTPHKFEANMRYEMLSGKGVTAIGDFSTIVTDTEIMDRFHQEKETVSVLFTKINPSDFTDKVTLEDEQITAWFAKNSNNYKTAAKVKLRFLFFPYKGEAANLSISEEQIEARYQENLSRYQEPEKRHAKHILLKADENSSSETHASQLAKAEDILTKAKGGDDFSDLAKTYSEGPSKDKGGDLGSFTRGQMVKPFDDAVFTMQAGAISEVVKTRFGYHIILLQTIQPAATRPLADVRAALLTELQSEMARPVVFKKANDAYEGIIAAGSLNGYESGSPDTAVLETEFFDRSAVPENMDNAPTVLTAAFSLKQGELSSLIESPNGYSVLYAEALEAPTVPELDSVLEKVTKAYKAEQAKTLAREQAESLLETLQAGTAFAEAVDAVGGKTEEASIHRNATAAEANGFPSSLIAELFTRSSSNPFPEKIATVGQDFMVYQFTERKLPKIEELTDTERELYQKEILSGKQDRLLMAWIRHQEDNADIFTNKNL